MRVTVFDVNTVFDSLSGSSFADKEDNFTLAVCLRGKDSGHIY